MSWPVLTVSTQNVDSATDNPGAARVEIKEVFDRVNDMIGARGAPDGVCELDGSSQVPSNRLANGLKKTNNLGDLGNVSSARTNLGMTATGSNVVTAATPAAALGVLGGVPAAGGAITGDIVQGGSPLATQAFVVALSAGGVSNYSFALNVSIPAGATGGGLFGPFGSVGVNDFVMVHASGVGVSVRWYAQVLSGSLIQVTYHNVNTVTVVVSTTVRLRVFAF